MKLLCVLLLSAAALWCGDLSARFDLTVNRILRGGPPQYNDDFVLADAVPRNTRRFTNFSGDVSGRYIGAMAMATRQGLGQLQPQANETLDRIVTKTLLLQKPDGHFGDPLSPGKVQNSDMAILWGNGRMLIGLLEYYQVKPRPEVLRAARKLGDFLVGIGPLLNSEDVRREYNGEKFAVGYICWTQNLEGVVELYRVTHEERYLALAKEIADRTDRHPAQHSHGFLTTLRGLVELYRVTHDQHYLDRAVTEWKGVVQSGNVLVQGGVPEMFAPQIKRDEGCSEADWLRLGLDLWRETREPEYLKQAEYALFNEFSFNQFHTGDFGHHTLTGSGMSAPTARAWWCCTFHGLRALVAVFESVFHVQPLTAEQAAVRGSGRADGRGPRVAAVSAEESAICYDLPVDGRIAANGLTLRADSSLGQNGTVRLAVKASSAQPATIAVRVPDWASEVTVSARGQKLAGTLRGGYLDIRRAWKSGDALTIQYVMKTRLQPPAKPGPRVAVLHGPWLLAVDEEASPNYFDEPSTQNQVSLPSAGEVKLEPSQMTPRLATPFSAPVAHLQLKYLPGGYPVEPGVALLRPIAEFTGGGDSNRLEFWLPVKPQIEKLDSNYHP